MPKKQISVLLFVALLLQMFTAAAFATEGAVEDELIIRDEVIVTDDDTDEDVDPEQGWLEDDGTHDRWIGLETGITSLFSDYRPRQMGGETIRRGIDVSQWNEEIDWTKVATSGVEFAIIRVAVRGYGEAGRLMADSRYKQNIEGALAAGLKVGVYIFSQAITPEEAIEEAELTLSLIRGYDIELPVVMDVEYIGNSGGRLYNAWLSRAEATEICLTFCNRVRQAGYTPMVYANRSMLENNLNASELPMVWLAHYTSETSYQGDYAFWQCSEFGRVDGIQGKVDLNFWFEPSAEEPEPEPEPLPFTDVPSSFWGYDAIRTAYEQGLVYGTSETTFEPHGLTTRGQVAAMLYRYVGAPAVSGELPFTDLTQDFYRDAILWAWQQGLMMGVGDDSVAPDDSITRQDLTTLLYRLEGQPAASVSLGAFTDRGEVSDYAWNAMCWAVENKLIYGRSEDLLDPRGTATRAEVTALLVRYINMKS